jgi:transcriptional regulator with XRE-family HTH domain
MTTRKRHSRIDVPEHWLRAVDEWRRARGLTLGQLGEAAAKAIGSDEPFHDATLSRFLRGHTSRELAYALAKLCDLPLPDVVVDEAEQKWLELGQRLNALDRRLFLDELAELHELVELRARTRARRDRSK